MSDKQETQRPSLSRIVVTGLSEPANGEPPYMAYHIKAVYPDGSYWTVATISDMSEYSPDDSATQIGEVLARKHGVECVTDTEFFKKQREGNE